MTSNHSKKRAFFLLIIMVTCSFLLPAQDKSVPQAQELLTSAVTAGQCAGMAAGFTVKGEILWMGSAGARDLKQGETFEPQTLTRIASITKPMTAVAVLQLFEQGKISLDEPIQTYLPDFPRKQAGEITVRHLLQHASGIPGYESGKERENKIHYANLQDAMRIFQDRDLLQSPGQAFHYSTYGYVVLGLLIEQVSGMDYASYLQKNIWEPAGMLDTGIEQFGQEYEGKSALYHLRSGKKIKATKPTDLSDRIPGGGVYSNVEDLLKFGQAIMDQKLLKAATLSMMWEDSGLKQSGNAYGMGWYLYGKNPRYGQVYGHNGAQTGASSFLMLLPEQETAIVVLSNTSGAMQAVSNICIKLFDVAADAASE